MKLLPFNSEKRIEMKHIILAVFYAIITMFAVVTTTNCDRPKDIPIEARIDV